MAMKAPISSIAWAAVSLATTLVPGFASAQTEGAAAIDLAWNAPAECPTRDVVRGELARALGPTASGQTAGRVQIDVERDADSSWTAKLHIVVRGIASQRSLHAESCETIASAAAVIAEVALEGPFHEPRPAPNLPSNESANDTRQGAPHGGASQLIVGLAGTLDTATQPSLDLGLEGDLGWARRTASWTLRAEASGSVFENRSTEVAGQPGEGGTFSLVTGGVRACATRVFGTLEAGPCLGGEVDFMSGSGTGTGAEQGSGAWGGLSGSALGTWNLGRAFGVTVRADGVLPLSRPPFVITRFEASDIVVHRPAPATFRMAVGIEARFF
jgi:hypothetical protein